MTPARFATLVRFYTGTNSTTFTDAEILALANTFKDEIAAEIAERNEDYFGMWYYRDLVADQREYSLPDEVLNAIKYTEAKLDGSNWARLVEFDLNSYEKPTDEDSIRLYFTDKEAMFEMFRRSLFIYSGDAITAVTEGLKLYAIIYPADISDLTEASTDMSVDPTTTSHGFPRQFHELLARRVSIAYKSSKDKPIPLSEKEKAYEDDLKAALDAITGGNLDRAVIATVPADVANTGASADGSDY